MADEIGREADVHGFQWANLHGGYFSDPDIAEVFGEKPGVLDLEPAGFQAYLHYRIYTCAALRASTP